MKNLLLGCFLFLFAFVMLPAADAKAYGITQTNATKTSVTISWEAEERALNYKVYVGTSYQDAVLYQTLPATQTSITINNLKAGSANYVKVEYDVLSYDQTTTYTYGLGSLYDAITLPGKVTNVKQDSWYYFILSFYATWDKQEGVDGYEYVVKTNTGKKLTSGDTKYNSNSVSISNIKNTVIYTMQVRAYTTFNGKKYYGPWSTKAYFFTQPRITSVKNSGGKLTIKWSKVNGATGYDIYVSLKDGKAFKKVKSVSKNTTSVTLTKFKSKKISSKKTYYVYIKTKKKVGKTTYGSGKLYYWNSKNSDYGYF